MRTTHNHNESTDDNYIIIDDLDDSGRHHHHGPGDDDILVHNHVGASRDHDHRVSHYYDGAYVSYQQYGPLVHEHKRDAAGDRSESGDAGESGWPRSVLGGLGLSPTGDCRCCVPGPS